jgi:hypothetical protein
VAIQDGDLEYDTNDYLKIIAKFADPEVKVVYGSRFAGRICSRMQWRYWLANMLLRTIANVLYGAQLTDEATAYKAFRRDVICNLPLRCRGFEFCPEVTAKLRKRGFRIHEVPITYDPRSVADGKKIGLKDGLMAVWTLVRLRFTRN